MLVTQVTWCLVMTGWSVHLCPLPVCDPFVAAESLAWWELGLCRGLTPSHCCSLSARKFHFVTTSSPLMTHNVMLNVIRPRGRRQEFSTDQTYTIPMPSKYLVRVNLKFICLSLTFADNLSRQFALWEPSDTGGTEKNRLPSQATHPCSERERGRTLHSLSWIVSNIFKLSQIISS